MLWTLAVYLVMLLFTVHQCKKVLCIWQVCKCKHQIRQWDYGQVSRGFTIENVTRQNTAIFSNLVQQVVNCYTGILSLIGSSTTRCCSRQHLLYVKKCMELLNFHLINPFDRNHTCTCSAMYYIIITTSNSGTIIYALVLVMRRC